MTAVLQDGLAPVMYPIFGGKYSSLIAAGYDIFALAGQSNIISRADIRAGIDDDYSQIAGRVFQYGFTSQTVTAATNPLDHVDENAGDMGLWLEFVKAILPSMPAGRNILLVPCGQGGTSFSGGNWNPGDSLYESAVVRMNAAMSQGAGVNRFCGVLWLQGESDADANNTGYRDDIQAMYEGLIDDVTAMTSSTPFICGTIKPDKPNASAINAALADFAVDNAAVALVDLTDLAWYDSDHYTAASMAIAGQRYAGAS